MLQQGREGRQSHSPQRGHVAIVTSSDAPAFVDAAGTVTSPIGVSKDGRSRRGKSSLSPSIFSPHANILSKAGSFDDGLWLVDNSNAALTSSAVRCR